VEVTRKSYNQNRLYCLKDVSGTDPHPKARKGLPELWRVLLDSGPAPEAGRPTASAPPSRRQRASSDGEFDSAAAVLRTGAPLCEALGQMRGGFALQHLSKIMQFQTRHVSPRDPYKGAPKVALFFGTTGTGKTLSAYHVGRRLCPATGPYMTMPQKFLQWWEGYEQQNCVIWDEFRDTQMDISGLLRLTDSFPMNVQVKGSSTPFNSSFIILTTDLDPRLFYATEVSTNHRAVDQFLRRLDLVVHFGPHEQVCRTTSLEPRFKISGELKSSWMGAPFVDSVVRPQVLPSARRASDDFLDELDSLFQESGIGTPSFPEDRVGLGEIRIPISAGVVACPYRILKGSREVRTAFGFGEGVEEAI